MNWNHFLRFRSPNFPHGFAVCRASSRRARLPMYAIVSLNYHVLSLLLCRGASE